MLIKNAVLSWLKIPPDWNWPRRISPADIYQARAEFSHRVYLLPIRLLSRWTAARSPAILWRTTARIITKNTVQICGSVPMPTALWTLLMVLSATYLSMPTRIPLIIKALARSTAVKWLMSMSSTINTALISPTLTVRSKTYIFRHLLRVRLSK